MATKKERRTERVERTKIRRERFRLAKEAGVSVASGAFARKGGEFSKEAARRSLARQEKVKTVEARVKPRVAVRTQKEEPELKAIKTLVPSVQLRERLDSRISRIEPEVQEQIRKTIPRGQETELREREPIIFSRGFVIGAVEPAFVIDPLGRSAEEAFQKFQKAEFAQRRKPTFFGAVRSGVRATEAAVKGALVGGRGVGRFVRERPIESVVLAAALLTPIPEEIPLLGAFGVRAATGLRAARAAGEIGLGTVFAVEAGRRIRVSPTPRLTTAEVGGEVATFGVGFKFLKAATSPRVVKAAILGGAGVLTGGLVGGRAAGIRAGRISKAELRKRGFGIRTPQQVKEAGELFTKASRLERLRELESMKPRIDERDIPSGKFKFFEKAGKLFLKKGKTIIDVTKLPPPPKDRPFIITEGAVSKPSARILEAVSQAEQIAILKPKAKQKVDKLPVFISKPKLPREVTTGRERVGETADIISKDLTPPVLFRDLIEPPIVEKPPKGFRSTEIRERLLERVEARRGEIFERAEVARAAATRFRRRVGEIGVSVGVGVREALGLVSPLNVLPVVSPVIIEKPALITSLAVGTALTPAIDTISDVDTRLITKPITTTEVIPIVDVVPISTTKRVSRGRPTPTPFVPPLTPPPTILPSIILPPAVPPPRIPPPFIVPPVTFFGVPDIDFERKPLVDSFFVEVRRKGVFSAFAKAESIEKAFRKGQREAETTAAASFRIREQRTGDIVDIFNSLSPRFRKSKKEPGVFIERRTFRISTIGELQEITFKGIAARGKSLAELI